MSTIGLKIKEIRKAQGLTQKELASLVFTTQGSIQKWESGATEPSFEKLKQLAEALKNPISIFLDYTPDIKVDVPDPQRLNPPLAELPDVTPITKRIPVVGMAAAENFDPELSPLCELWEDDSVEYIPCVLPNCDDVFGLQISGDSMAPALLDGDIVAVRDKLPETGKVCVAMHRTDGIICKEWYWRHGIIRLISLNEGVGKNYEWTKEQYIAEQPLVWRFLVEGIVWRKNIKRG